MGNINVQTATGILIKQEAAHKLGGSPQAGGEQNLGWLWSSARVGCEW